MASNRLLCLRAYVYCLALSKQLTQGGKHCLPDSRKEGSLQIKSNFKSKKGGPPCKFGLARTLIIMAVVAIVSKDSEHIISGRNLISQEYIRIEEGAGICIRDGMCTNRCHQR